VVRRGSSCQAIHLSIYYHHRATRQAVQRSTCRYSPPHSVDNATTKASATPPVNSPAQSPAKPPGKTRAKSPAKSPAKTRGSPPGKPPTPKQKRVGNHTAATSVVHVDKRVPLPRSARLAAEAVDISAGNDRMGSGDEDDYGLDDDDESDAEYIIDDAED
ncbi:hypothetical protein F441_19178, partial [Phytophthora nicotianae CJ01A1]